MDVSQFVNTILSGGVVLCPTDTVYGLAVKPDIKIGVDKIYELKMRPRDRNLPIMIDSIDGLKDLNLDINSSAKQFFDSIFIPGPLTLILGFSIGTRPSWLEGRDEVAIRIPNDVHMLEVLKRCGPLLVTSANKHSSSRTANNVSEILRELNGTPDLILDRGILHEIPSTIINCRFDPWKIERLGSLSEEILKHILSI